MLPKILLGVGIVATIFSVLIFSGKIPLGGNKDQKATGEVFIWGTLPDVDMQPIIQQFNPKVKTYTVRYKYIPEQVFEKTLIEALANGQGPDAILAPHQIILSQSDRMYPFQVAEKYYRDMFVDGASIFLTTGGVVALPVSIEPMVLFYNRSLFSKHGVINPPATWNEVAAVTPTLTVKQGAQFTESAIAFGAPNVSYAKDIIMAMVAQLGQVPVLGAVNADGERYYSVQVNEPIGEKRDVFPLVAVARYFTQFADPGQINYTWSSSQGDPSDQFVGEKLAMYIGYSGEYQKLRVRNPRGDFQMTTFPQTKGYNTFSMGMRMYGIATLKTAKNLKASLAAQVEFSSIGMSSIISNVTGGVPAIRSYAATPTLDPVIAQSMLVARGWYDKFSKESTEYAVTMISDIISYRFGVNDAATLFVGRLRDLYAKKF